jgi:DNA-binding response OmpR family regulator
MVPTSPLSIFVVEDDEDISKLIQMHLIAAGFAVRSFSTAIGVIKEAEQSTPALFLLDVMLPGIDGLSLCREIKKHDLLKTVPVMVLTAKAGASERTAALNSGADDYLIKPFGRAELITRVRTLCERSRS